MIETRALGRRPFYWADVPDRFLLPPYDWVAWTMPAKARRKRPRRRGTPGAGRYPVI